MKRICLCLLILLCGSITSCGPAKSPIEPAKSPIEIERDIRETVFRHQFKSWDAGHQKVFFLAIGSKKTDPSDEFMQRFANHHPPVKKASESYWFVRNGSGIVKDKASNELGLIFHTNEIKWLNSSKVEIEGGYITASLGASYNAYIVEKQNEKWVVIKDTTLAVA